jgi:hypothetical protein
MENITSISVSPDSGNPRSSVIAETGDKISTDDQVMSEVAAVDANVGSGTAQVKLLENDRDISFLNDNLAVPTEWLEEARSHPCLERAISFIDRLSQTGRETPWLITSMTHDLSGSERSDSQDHSSGLAMDIAPMFSGEEVLPSDPPMLGLAWNVKSLVVLGQAQWGDIPMFVEGDHLHLSSSIKPSDVGVLPLMWSTSTFYSSAQQEQNDPLLMKLVNSFWKWDTATLTLSPPSALTKEWAMSLLTKIEPQTE